MKIIEINLTCTHIVVTNRDFTVEQKLILRVMNAEMIILSYEQKLIAVTNRYFTTISSRQLAYIVSLYIHPCKDGKIKLEN